MHELGEEIYMQQAYKMTEQSFWTLCDCLLVSICAW